jgi:hypothetical protein
MDTKPRLIEVRGGIRATNDVDPLNAIVQRRNPAFLSQTAANSVIPLAALQADALYLNLIGGALPECRICIV